MEEREEIINEGVEHNEIYGTNINIKKTMVSLESFIVNFEAPVVTGEVLASETIYRSQLIEIQNTEASLFEVDGRHLYEADRSLYMQFIYYPAEMISCFDHVLKDVYDKYFIESETNEVTRSRKVEQKESLMLGINHLHDNDMILIKDLNSSKIGRLVSLQGIVIRASEIYPEMKSAYFRCT
jgi:DNA replication licensing factor MCM4